MCASLGWSQNGQAETVERVSSFGWVTDEHAGLRPGQFVRLPFLTVLTPPEVSPKPGGAHDDLAEIDRPEAEDSVIDLTQDAGDPERQPWLRRHARTLALGAAALGAAGAEIAITHASGVSVSSLASRAWNATRWAGPALAASEFVFTAGLAIAALGAGQKIGNPFTLRSRWAEIRAAAADSRLYRLGIMINMAGSLATNAILAAASVATLPPESLPVPLSVLTADAVGTIAVRRALLPSPEHTEERVQSREHVPQVGVRLATDADIDALVDLDLRLFRRAYGETPPAREEVATMFRHRLHNNPDGMFVAVVDGEIRGFATAFRTSTPIEDFVSWEESTNHGTLDGKVDPEGGYLYIANLTMDTTHGAGTALDSLIAFIFAKAIEDGVEYGYFCSRMPGFKRWAERRASRECIDLPEGEALDVWAEEYAGLTHPVDNKGQKVRPLDPELAFYATLPVARMRPVPNAFEDDASLNYQVPFRGEVPLHGLRHIRFARRAVAGLLRGVAQHPKLLGLLNKVI